MLILIQLFIALSIYRKEKVLEISQQHTDQDESSANNNSGKANKDKNTFASAKMNEYLLGSRKLKIFPVAMSLVGR